MAPEEFCGRKPNWRRSATWVPPTGLRSSTPGRKQTRVKETHREGEREIENERRRKGERTASGGESSSKASTRTQRLCRLPLENTEEHSYKAFKCETIEVSFSWSAGFAASFRVSAAGGTLTKMNACPVFSSFLFSARSVSTCTNEPHLGTA